MEARWRWAALTAVAPIAWGSTYFVTAHFLPAGDPLWGAVFRALPAGLILLLVARRRPRGSWWWRSIVLGVLNVGGFFVLVYVAAQTLPSSIAATIMATSAGVLMLLAWPLLAERPTALAVVSAVVGFAGVCVLLLQGSVGIQPLGVVASLTAMLMSSVGFVLTKRWASDQPVIAVSAWQLIAGGVVVLPIAALLNGAPPQLDAPAVGGFVYLTLVATALAYVAWFSGLRHLTAAAVGVIGLLNPLTGVLLGTLLAGEPFGLQQAAGTALVLAGVLLGQRRPAARPAVAP